MVCFFGQKVKIPSTKKLCLCWPITQYSVRTRPWTCPSCPRASPWYLHSCSCRPQLCETVGCHHSPTCPRWKALCLWKLGALTAEWTCWNQSGCPTGATGCKSESCIKDVKVLASWRFFGWNNCYSPYSPALILADAYEKQLIAVYIMKRHR